MEDRTGIKRIAAQCVGVAALLLAACGSDASGDGSAGTLVVKFQLGNDRTCDALGVSTVRAELNDKEYVREDPCENGQVRFLNLPAGSYHIKLYGLDDMGVEIMDSYTSSETTVNTVGDDQTTVVEPAVTLTAAPAHLLVRWNFGFGTCKALSIDRFAIKAWRGSGNDLLLSETLPCSLEGDGKDQYRDIDDPDRRFGGDESGEVSVQPYDKNSVTVGMAAVFKFKAPGPGHDIKLSVTCEDNACTGSGKPD